MYEYTTTRHNHLIDPSLHIWGWEIPVYLFLGGLVAGMMIVMGYFLVTGRHRDERCVCGTLPAAGILLLSLGMLALFLDLEHKLFTWRLYTTFMPASPMSWGAWILLLVYPALAAAGLIEPPAPLLRRLPALAGISGRLRSRHGYARAVGALNIGLGALLGIYTGVLLSALGARPLWNSAMLWVLFLVSGLSTASAFVHMVARNEAERVLLAKADNVFLLLELFVLGLFLVGLLSSTKVHIASARLLLSGAYAPVFWTFVVGLGIVVPLILQHLAVRHRIRHSPVVPLLVLAGGLILRFVIVQAGQASRWVDAAYGALH
jgi:formate-dependent nitrite reductase membrane component NrfD